MTTKKTTIIQKHSMQFLTIIAASLIISITSSSSLAFAEETMVSLPADSGVPGCETDNMCYIPYMITIKPGDTVVWNNDDTAAHTVTSGVPPTPDGTFDSGIFMAGTTFSHTFDKAGTYPYFCIVHPWMIGTVTVSASSAPPPANSGTTTQSPVTTSNTVALSSAKSMKVSGTESTIGYAITDGKVVSVFPDTDSNSLIVGISANNAGMITLELPRSVIDAKMGSTDEELFVLIDGEEVTFEESVTNAKRELKISYPAGAEEIEIIGTFVVPEFGAIAMMVLAVAIISMIAVSARSRLSIIMPRA